MKGEYVEPNTTSTNTMFLYPHPHHKFQHPQHLQSHHPPFPQCHDPTTTTNDDDDDDDSHSHSTGAAALAITTTTATTTTTTTPTKRSKPSEDGATIEVVRRPRGRPPGSKNKPKPPVIITREPEPAMSPYVLEVPGGNDVVEALSRFCRRRNLGLCVLTGSGTVANVTLRQPSTTPGATVTFHGRFDILSISATFLPPTSSSPSLSSANGFTISLAGPQGQIIGGSVSGALLAAGTVFIIAASFNNPMYHRLPMEEEAPNSFSANEGQSPTTVSGGGEGGHPAAESCGMSMYSCHLPSDVIWAPTPRQPQHQPPPPY